MKLKLRVIVLLSGMLLLGAAATLFQIRSAEAQGDSRYFPETGFTVKGAFWQYWQEHGGLAQQGYPISAEFQEKSDLNGQVYLVQYFERAVFEYHPENAGNAYEVLLSQLGTFRHRQKYLNGVTGAQSANEIGSKPGMNALEYIGQIDQQGFDFTAYGYLTHINGVPDEQLFTNSTDRSEATARFTYYATAQVTARSIISSVFVLNSAGDFNIYYNDYPQGNFNNPESFRLGANITTDTIRHHNILNVLDPNRGISFGTADMTQQTATPFTMAGQQYQFGRPGLFTRVTNTSTALRSEPNIPIVLLFGAGEAVVTGQE